MHPTFLRYRYEAGYVRVEGLKFFTYKSGEPIKFRIQSRLDSSLRTKLEDIIETHGGLVISKIPVKGVVVVDHESESGREIVRYWKRKERSERYFVDYQYILKCADEKRMIPFAKYTPGNDVIMHTTSKGRNKVRRELSQEAKDKLALYLATKLPDDLKNNLSSSRIYKDLWKEREQYPWVKKYSWQMFRDHYCKNRKYYDKAIKYIVMASPANPHVAEEVCDDKHEDVARQTQFKPSRPKHCLMESGKSQHVKAVYTGRKRKFADDITNIGKGDKMKSIDEMLRKPMPCFKVRKSQRLEKKNAKAKKPKLELEGLSPVPPRRLLANQASDTDHDEIEVGRPTSQPSRMEDVWIDDDFRGNSVLRTELEELPQAESQDKLAAMTANFKLDLDDLRSAVALNSSIWKDDEDTEDEDYVARLLGLTDEPTTGLADLDFKTAASKCPDSHPRNTTFVVYSGSIGNNTLADLEDYRKTEIETLALDSQFTSEEIALKLAAFAGDLDKTREFFIRCREIVDELYAGFLKDSSSALNVSPATLKSVKASQVKLKKNDISTEMQPPARNTRARQRALGRRGSDSRVQRSG